MLLMQYLLKSGRGMDHRYTYHRCPSQHLRSPHLWRVRVLVRLDQNYRYLRAYYPRHRALLRWWTQS